jgi:hypothetical protein
VLPVTTAVTCPTVRIHPGGRRPGGSYERAEAVPCGPDLDRHVEALQAFADAGVDELFVQQIGPEQDAFFDTWAAEVLPRFA